MLALRAAKDLGVNTTALLGEDGGAKALADFAVLVPSDSSAQIQEVHIFSANMIYDLIRKELGLV